MRGHGLDDRPDGEQHQRHDLQDHEHVLDLLRHLDADRHEDRDEDDPADAAERTPEGGIAEAVQPEEVEHVLRGDLREVGHHDHRCGDRGETDHPADLWAEGARRPDEGLAAVRIRAVHVVEAAGDEQHRDEGRDHDERRRQADDAGDEADRRGQAVSRSHRGDAEHNAAEQSDGARLKPLVAGSDRRLRGQRSVLHLIPPSRRRRPTRGSVPSKVGRSAPRAT